MQQQQQGVESPLPADPMQRLKMDMLRDQASRARDEEMLRRSIEQKKVRDLVGQTGVVERSRGMLDPQSVMRESEMDPRSVVREGEMSVENLIRAQEREGEMMRDPMDPMSVVREGELEPNERFGLPQSLWMQLMRER
jgi:hypothetical protein